VDAIHKMKLRLKNKSNHPMFGRFCLGGLQPPLPSIPAKGREEGQSRYLKSGKILLNKYIIKEIL
jgi:hypothetical protein